MSSRSLSDRVPRCGLAVMAALAISGCGAFRGERPAASPAAEPESKVEATAEKAADIATQPARDIGVAKPDIPPALVRAT